MLGAMYVFTLLLVYGSLVFAASMLGGRMSMLLKMTHLRTQLLMSAVGGLMLGIAMLHLLPHAVESLGSASQAGAAALIGLAAMFLLIRWFHTHEHVVSETTSSPADDAETRVDEAHQTGEHHHDHHDSSRGIGWAGLFFGLLLHTLVDGVALAASVIAESEHAAWLGLAGFGTFLAVALHKPLDAFAITSVMNRQHWSRAAQRWVNLAFSLGCPVGAIGFYLGVSRMSAYPAILGWGLAVSAGFFIGIALADLLPEVEFHHHDRGKLTASFLLGISVAVAVEKLPGHAHATHPPELHHHDHQDQHEHQRHADPEHDHQH